MIGAKWQEVVPPLTVHKHFLVELWLGAGHSLQEAVVTTSLTEQRLSANGAKGGQRAVLLGMCTAGRRLSGVCWQPHSAPRFDVRATQQLSAAASREAVAVPEGARHHTQAAKGRWQTLPINSELQECL